MRTLVVGGHGLVARRHGEIGRALKDEEFSGLLGEDRNRLDRGRAGANDPHAFSRQIHPVFGPVSRVVMLAAKSVQARKIGGIPRREASRGRNQEACTDLLAAVGADHPPARRFVEDRGLDAGLECNIPTQTEAVGHVIRVGEDLGLRAVALGPVPLLVEFLRERIRVGKTLDVAARSRVAIPEPGAPDPTSRLIHLNGKPDLPKPVEGVQAAETRAHHDDVQMPLGHFTRCL